MAATGRALSRRLSRRSIVAAGAPAAAAFISNTAAGSPIAGDMMPERKTPGRIINICDPPYNADPTGQTNAAPALQDAFDVLGSLGGGLIVVPPGDFRLDFPVGSGNGAISVWGSGAALSVFVVRHAGVALSFNCYNVSQAIEIRDIGLSPTPSGGGTAGIAVSIQFPDENTGWVHCNVSNVDAGVARPGYTCFATGFRLINCRRANFNGLNVHSNVQPVPGTYGVLLNGFCVDNHFDQCFIEGVDFGFGVNAYGEGLTISRTVVITTTGVSTGSSNYNNGINLLGLYISDCEFNCSASAAHLFQVTTGWLSGTHFGGKTADIPAVALAQCDAVQMFGCQISGEFNPDAPQRFVGIYLVGSVNCTVDVTVCTNLLIGLEYGHGTISCTATGLRDIAPYGQGLIGTPITDKGYTLRAVLDASGNDTNFAQWLSNSGFMTSVHRKAHGDNASLALGLQ